MDGLSGSGSSARRCQGVGLAHTATGAVDPHRPSDVLNLLLPSVLEGVCQLIPYFLVDLPGDAVPPGSASCSKRAATFTPSPNASPSSSMMMSPRLMPMRICRAWEGS